MSGAIFPKPRGTRSLVGILPWMLKFLVSAGLMWYLFSRIPVADALDRAAAIPISSLLGAYALVMVQAVLGGLRWKVVIAAIGARLSLARSMLITFMSLFFSQFLPSSLGADLVRMWQSKRAGLPLATAVTSVMLERFGNLLCVISLVLITLPAWTYRIRNESMGAALMMVGLLGAVSLAVLMILDRLPSTWHRWRIVRGFVVLARDARSLFLQPRAAVLLIATATAGQVALAGATFVLATGLGLEVEFIDSIVLMPPVALISSLPISVAGWGVRELTMVAAFATLSIPAEGALALSIVLALTGIAVSLPGGLIWLLLKPAPRGGPRDGD